MRAALTKWSRFGLLSLIFMTLTVVIVRLGQSDTFPSAYCWPAGSVSCPICPVGTPRGYTCSTPYAAPWQEGDCYNRTTYGPACYEEVAYDCGFVQTCATPPLVTMTACAKPVICHE